MNYDQARMNVLVQADVRLTVLNVVVVLAHCLLGIDLILLKLKFAYRAVILIFFLLTMSCVLHVFVVWLVVVVVCVLC